MRALLLVFALSLPIGIGPGELWATSLGQRAEAVGKVIDMADEMFAGAKKGHLPSLEAINSLQARLALARQLHAEAKGALDGGKTYEAGAKFDAAEYLAQKVLEASKH